MNSRYRLIAGSIDAWQWLPDDDESNRVIADVLREAGITPELALADGPHHRALRFCTAFGDFSLFPGSWLIRSVKTGSIWVIHGDFFLALFEPAQYAGERSRLELVEENDQLRDRVSTCMEALTDINRISSMWAKP